MAERIKREETRDPDLDGLRRTNSEGLQSFASCGRPPPRGGTRGETPAFISICVTFPVGSEVMRSGEAAGAEHRYIWVKTGHVPGGVASSSQDPRPF